MKLLNQSIKFVSISLLAIIVLWGIVFFFNMTAEINENVDEGLSNYKRQIIYRIHQDTTLLSRRSFDDGFFAIRESDKNTTRATKDFYTDTLVRIQNLGEANSKLDPVRMLTTSFEDDGKYYELKIINPTVEKDDLIRRLLFNMIWLYIGLIVTIIFVNNLVLRRLWKPFYDLLYKLQSYRLGSTQKFPAIKTKTKEFKDLEEAVQTLLDHNLQIFEQQKQFIGNASHELQTPLAIAITKLELLLEEEKLEVEQAEKMVEILEIIERLVRLNKSLLLLTKIENRQFLDTQPINLNQLVHLGIEHLKDLSHYKNLQISFEEKDKLIIEMNPSLAEILINNLLKNAIYHNLAQDGKIIVLISRNRLSICNTGEDSALDASVIFKRFYKSSGGKDSTGLGLAIVKAVSDLYGIEVKYSFESKNHCFELLF